MSFHVIRDRSTVQDETWLLPCSRYQSSLNGIFK